MKINKSLYTKAECKALIAEKRIQKNKKKDLPTQNFKLQNELEISTPNKIAFVLGNGTSRQGINLEKLKKFGPIYGCNAIYRDFLVDYLIAVDVKMVLEINMAGFQNHNKVYTNPNKAYSKMKNLNFFQPSKGWSSGPTALWLASTHKYEQIYILGFDYKGLAGGKIINNIYADTRNYKKSTDGATFFGNWMRQTRSVLQEFKHIKYTRIIDDTNNFSPRDLEDCKNYNTLHVNFFKKHFAV